MKETNMEHFRGEIEKIIGITANRCPAVVNGKPVACVGTPCGNCDLYEKAQPCTPTFVKWLMSEYKPELVLTAREKHFVEFAQEGWLARDEDDNLNYFHEEPCKDDERWLTGDWRMSLWMMELNNMFPFITWEDEEPWSVEELRKLKVKE